MVRKLLNYSNPKLRNRLLGAEQAWPQKNLSYHQLEKNFIQFTELDNPRWNSPLF